jgi:hypothetical protein
MRQIIGERQKFEGRTEAAREAVEYLKSRNENFKVEYCEELIERGEKTIGFL